MSKSAVFFISFFTSVVTAVATVLLMQRITIVPKSDLVTVPKLAGLSEQDARTNLSALGLTTMIAGRKAVNGAEPGTVVEQMPLPGLNANKGDAVSLVLAEDAPEVPTLTGRDVAEATLLLEQVGLRIQVGEEVDSDTVPEGKIASQVPAAGANLAKGRTVTVHPSGGKGKIEVPKVTGKKQSRAKSILEKAGFVVGDVHWKYDDTKSPYVVLSQKPAAGEKAKPKTAIELWVNED